jgi:hypothetical protein
MCCRSSNPTALRTVSATVIPSLTALRRNGNLPDARGAQHGDLPGSDMHAPCRVKCSEAAVHEAAPSPAADPQSPVRVASASACSSAAAAAAGARRAGRRTAIHGHRGAPCRPPSGPVSWIIDHRTAWIWLQCLVTCSLLQCRMMSCRRGCGERRCRRWQMQRGACRLGCTCSPPASSPLQRWGPHCVRTGRVCCAVRSSSRLHPCFLTWDLLHNTRRRAAAAGRIHIRADQPECHLRGHSTRQPAVPADPWHLCSHRLPHHRCADRVCACGAATYMRG